jgi:hypothetical protein
MSEEAVAKTGNWFNKLSKTKKGLLIGGGITLILVVGYFVLRKKPDEANATTDNQDESSGGSGGIDSAKESLIIKKPNSSSSSHITKPTPYSGSLPNGGVGCGDVKVSFDRDFDYVKCNGEWFVKSKAHPFTAAAKGKHPDWFSLKANKVSTERLNRRYP